MGLTKPRAHQLQDIDYKQTARALTDTNITLSGSAPATVDGVSLSLHDRVLVTGQTDASENGIYYVTTVGAGSDGTWARSLDANETGELNGGTIIMVTEGTNHADTQWKLTTDDPITIGSTNLNFALNSSAAYGVIAVAGQSSIAANSVGDTLTVATGNNIVVTTNAGTETLTIAVSDTITATGNITGGNITTAGIGTFGTMTDGTVSFTSGNISGVDELRIDQSGTGLRMTNVGAFDNDGSDNFRIFSTNDLKIAANGENGTAITVDATNQDVTVTNDLRVDAGNLYIGGTAVTATATELNLLDGVTGLTLGNANEILIVGSDNTSIEGTDILTIDTASNYVGINQTSPEVTLHMTGEGAQTAQIRMEQYNDSADAPDVRTRRYRGTIASPSAIQSGDYLFRSNHEYYNGSALIVGGQFAFDNTNNANRTQFTVAVTTDGTSVEASTNDDVQFKIDGNDSGAITFNNAYKFPTSDGSANQFLQTDGAGNISFVDVSTTSIDNGTSNVSVVSSGGNVTVGVAGNEIVEFSTDGLIVTGNILPSANITYNLGSDTERWNELFLAGNTLHVGSLQLKDNGGSFEVFQSDGTTPAQITGNIAAANVIGTVASATTATTAGTVTTAAQPNITSVGTLSSVTVTGNVSAGNVDGTTGAFTTVTGAGSGITSLNADELSSGTVPSGRLSGTYTIDISGSATTAGTVTTAAQPNITSVGTLSGVTVSGNAVIGGDLTVSGNTVYTNVTTFSVQDPIIDLGRGANGAPLISDDGKDRGTQLYYYSGSEKSAFVGYDNSEDKIILAKDVSISDEVVTVSTYGNTVVGGLEATTIEASGNIDAGNVNATSISGTLITAAQTNITSVGTLTSVTTSGNITATGNININDRNGLYLYDSDSSNYIAIVSPSTVSGNVTFTLPGDSGTDGQFITTDGSGNLSFSDGGSATEEGKYPNSTVKPVPGSDGNFDLAKQYDQTGSAETPFEDTGSDAFGVSLGQIYSLMDPVGDIPTATDLGVLT